MLKKLLLSLLIVLTLPFAAACNDQSASSNGGTSGDDTNNQDLSSDGCTLGEEIADEIKQAYYDENKLEGYKSPDEVVILEYFGNYGDAYVVDMASLALFAAVITTETVDGVDFIYPDTKLLTVYSGGELYTLTQAFEAKLLNHENLVAVHEKYVEYRPYLYSE